MTPRASPASCRASLNEPAGAWRFAAVICTLSHGMRTPTLIAALAACLALAACGRDADPEKAAAAKAEAEAAVAAAQAVANTAVETHNLDLATCMSEVESETPPETSTCPSFVLLSLDYMIDACTAVGSKLKAAEESRAWSLEVDGDDKSEVMIDLTENFYCEGAPSLFSCGSLGCPFFIYTQRGDGWVELGAVNADNAPGIEVLQGTAGTPATLRGGCLGERPCSELTHYEWKNQVYEGTWIDFRGNIVDVAPGGLWTLTQDMPVLAAPQPGATELDSYPAGTTVVVIGSSRTGPYKFISPCNACRSGFVAAKALKK